MSDAAEQQSPLDLSSLRLMPSWVAEFSKAQPNTAPDYSDVSERPQRGHDRGDNRGGGQSRVGGGQDRGRDAGRGPRSDAPRGERRPADRSFPPRESGGGGRDFRGPPRSDRRDGPRGNFGRRDDRRDDRGPRFDGPPASVRGLNAVIEPEIKGVEAMAHMIRTAGKSYSVFDAARLVLTSGDRFHVRLTLAPESNLKFTIIAAEPAVFLSRDEALAHLLHSDLLDHFYRAEEVELEEPKENFTSVAVCGMTGELLGPPSHHAYQTTLHKIHRERFANMPFEDYKRRVRTDATPEAVEKWKESQKRARQWVDIITQVPEGTEPKRFKSRAEMEADFRKHHAEPLLSEATEAVIAGNIPKEKLSPALYNALRRSVDEARKHLLATAQLLCTGFEKQGLKLFKRRGGKLWVSRIRPRALEPGVLLSDRIAKMLEVIKASPGITVKQLVEIIAPTEVVEAEKTEAVEQVAPTAEAAPLEKVEPVSEAPASVEESEIVETHPAAPKPAPVKEAAPVKLSAEQMNALRDLHWLNSEGYVIEYADGIVFIGVTEPPPAKPKPVKPAPETAAPGEVTDEKIKVASVDETQVEEPMVAPTPVEEVLTPPTEAP